MTLFKRKNDLAGLPILQLIVKYTQRRVSETVPYCYAPTDQEIGQTWTHPSISPHDGL
jgi:hypothetical protein